MHQFDPPLGFPRVHAECDYRKPLRFEDLLEVHLLVKEKKPRVLTYLFKFRIVNAEPVEIARGSLTVVCVSHTPGKMEAVAMPVELASQIETAPPESLL
jgi:acyl-CoA thioesterase FadM